MSNQVNSLLFERVAELITYFEGKAPAEVLEADLDRNDLDALRKHVSELEPQVIEQEYTDAF